MTISLSPTSRDLVRSTFFGKDFDSYRQEIIDSLTAIYSEPVATNIVSSEQGVMLIELNAFALQTAAWYGDRQADDTTLQYARLRFAAVTVARQLGYKASSAVPAVVDVRVQLASAPLVQLTIARGSQATGPDGLVFETLADLVFDPGQIGSGLPAGLAVRDIVVDPAASANIYAATSNGVLKTTTGGTSWVTSNSGLSNSNVTAIAIDPVTTTTIYVGTISSGIFKSTDAGVSWASSSSGLSNLNITSVAIDPISPAVIYVTTDGGGIFKSINSGATWTAINGGILDFSLLVVAIDPATPATLYAGAFSGGVFKSINSGLSWGTANSGLAFTNVKHIAIDPVTPTTLYASTVGGGIYKSTNSATTWTPVNSGFTGLSPNKLVVDPTTPANLYASTADAGVFKSTDSGATWSSAVTGLTVTNNTAISVDPNTPTTLYVGATDGGIYGSTNSATTWAALNNGIDDPIKIVQMREGQTRAETFRSSGDPFQIFEIPTPTGTAVAQGSPSVSVAGVLWPEVSLLTYDQTDQVEIEYGLNPPRVIFGDGIAGNIPPKDAEVRVEYFTTSGSLGSIASDTIGNFTTPIIAGTTTIGTILTNALPSTPGSDPESIDSIKVNAPQVFQAARRAVTADDLTGWVNSFVDPVYGAVAKGRATSPRSAAADAEGQSIIQTLIAFGVPTTITDRLATYLNSILSSNCSANVVNAQILAADSIGRYVPASSGLAQNLADFLNGIAESTVEVVVTDGSINLLSVDAVIGIKILSTITNEALRNQIRDDARNAVQALLLGRDFGDSLRIGDIYQTVEAVDGVQYSQITLVVRNNIGDDVSSARLNRFGDLEIEEFEVITLGASPEVSFL
ncbi:MAG: hypothetical protein AB7L09_00330 [Nitrospira sp.]